MGNIFQQNASIQPKIVTPDPAKIRQTIIHQYYRVRRWEMQLAYWEKQPVQNRLWL